MRSLVQWWRQPDHFDWLVGYLQARGFSNSTRRILAAIAASLLLLPPDVLWGRPLFHPRIALVFAVVAALVGLGWAGLWLSRWPTRRQSILYAITGSVTAAIPCLWEVHPLVGLMGCSALVIPGGYIAFFHTTRFMALNFALAVIAGAIETVRLAVAGEVTIALTCYFLVLELNALVPLAIQVVVRALGVDLLSADRDPLTGLLNRRACAQAIVGRMLVGTDGMFLAVAMVDLDRFKQLNDSQGHAAGDMALVAVARALRAACPDTALVSRVGGEEFLIADIVTTEQPGGWGQHLCDAVTAMTPAVTASVGTAALALHDIRCDDADEAFRTLVDRADTAMYEAKRCGGNQARHNQCR